jgi:hypothetical protein
MYYLRMTGTWLYLMADSTIDYVNWHVVTDERKP